jgi:hypothetical protein
MCHHVSDLAHHKMDRSEIETNVLTSDQLHITFDLQYIHSSRLVCNVHNINRRIVRI